MKKWHILLIVGGLILLSGIFFGAKLAGGLALLGIGNEIRKRKKKTEKAKEKSEQAEQNYEETKQQNDKEIQEAGEDINAEDYNNADDARDDINDFINGNGK